MSVRDPDPIGHDQRRERRRRELPEGAACPECGEDDPLLLELHEPGGRANDPDARVVLCQRCHRRQSARQPEVGVDLTRDPDRPVVERVISVLRGLAAMFAALAQSCKTWADKLTAFVASLDATYPRWRELPGS